MNDTDNVLIAESGASQLWEGQRVQRLASGTEGKSPIRDHDRTARGLWTANLMLGDGSKVIPDQLGSESNSEQ